jgi:uncharacterized protein with GYD domain
MPPPNGAVTDSNPTMGGAMPKYLVTARYSPEGARGVIKGGGGTARVEAVRQLVESVGGTVESLYFAFGGTDVYITVDAPDNAAVAAVAMTVGASGALSAIETIVLLTPEEVDEAARRTVNYRAPGT